MSSCEWRIVWRHSRTRTPRKILVQKPTFLGQQPTDTPYEWDLDKKAWFPKITEDFIATYQANYGFSNIGASSSTASVQDVVLGLQKNLHKDNSLIPVIRKGREKRERLNQDGFMLKMTEIQCLCVWFACGHYSDEFICLCRSLALLSERSSNRRI